jgi:hypothetical protein
VPTVVDRRSTADEQLKYSWPDRKIFVGKVTGIDNCDPEYVDL